VVGVQAAGDRADHLVVPHQELEVHLLRELDRVEDALVHERGPPFVHDLGLDLRDEVLRLLVHDREQVLLPALQEGVVVADEEQEILVGRRRRMPHVGLGRFGAAMDPVERVVGRARRLGDPVPLVLLGELADGEIAPALERQRVRGVEHRLDAVEADARHVDVAPHPVGVCLERGRGEFGAGGPEREVVLEEVVVPVDVRDREDLKKERVVAHQVREGGVRVDDHLVRQPGHAVVVEGLQFLVRLAVGPMRVVRRHAGVRHVRQHLRVIAELELLRVAVEAEARDLLADARVPALQVREAPRRHGRQLSASARSLPRNALKEGQMSSLRSISTVWKLSASSRRNTFSMELS